MMGAKPALLRVAKGLRKGFQFLVDRVKALRRAVLPIGTTPTDGAWPLFETS
jgi:hypothetical protein